MHSQAFSAVIWVAAVVGSAVANFNYGAPPGRPAGVGPAFPVAPVSYPPMPYNFGYGVADSFSGNDFGHSESSDGNGVQGSYYVLLPDGRKQVVSYTADFNGYQAEVVYEGVARIPSPPIGGPVGGIPVGPKPGYGK